MIIPKRERWIAYGACTLAFGLVFLMVYPICNWAADHRSRTFALYLPVEVRIPFLPQFVWAYLSLWLLWPLQAWILTPEDMRLLAKRLATAIASGGLCFLAFPGRLGFVRELPVEPLLRRTFQVLFSIDQPHNLVPSLHVASSSLVVFSLGARTGSAWARAGLALWLALICASTVLVHQHHLLDVGAGFLLALLVHCLIRITPGAGRS